MNITREQVRAARCYLDWSRQDLFRAAGVSPQTIKNFEAEVFSPNENTRNAIAGALAAQGIEFFEGGVRKRKLCQACGHAPDAPPKADWMTVIVLPEGGLRQATFTSPEDSMPKQEAKAVNQR